MESLSKVAHRRLYPSLRDPAFLALRSRRLIFSAWASVLGGERLTVLDVGGQLQPYRPLFRNLLHYFAIDLVKTDVVSVVGNAEQLPFAPNSFDVAIATQVFEYFQNPRETAKQIYSALRPGGVLLGSFAACTPRFVDDERWRFTPSGLRLILESFARVEIVPELYSMGGIVRTVNLALDTLVRHQSVRRVYRLTMCPVLNLLGLGVESLKLTRNDQFTTNYSVRAIKAQ
jgi:SAM-dependent methyltransferase